MSTQKLTPATSLGFASLLSIVLSASQVQAFTITYEAPGVVSASSAVGPTTQVDFNALNTGQQGYNYTYTDVSGVNVRASYDSIDVYNYGVGSVTAGASNTKFISQFKSGSPDGVLVTTTTLTFTNTANNSSVGINYFGLFWSSLDTGNQLQFYNGTTLLNTLNVTNVPTLLNNNALYKTSPYTGEYSAFFNFYADTGNPFTKIVFTQTTGGGFESDNHTFRIPSALVQTGTPVTGGITVPEPSFLLPLANLMAGFLALSVYRKRAISDV